jgi:hypothetical protein
VTIAGAIQIVGDGWEPYTGCNDEGAPGTFNPVDGGSYFYYGIIGFDRFNVTARCDVPYCPDLWTWVTDSEKNRPFPQPRRLSTGCRDRPSPVGRSLTKQRIYRSQTGSSGTYLYLIAEGPASASSFVDTVPVHGFDEALPSADWNPPPDALTGLIDVPNGMMSGFVGRALQADRTEIGWTGVVGIERQ